MPGRSSIGGRDVTTVEPAARDVTFVFQQYSLYPHLSVFDNLAFPLRSPVRRVPEARDQAAGAGGGRAPAHPAQAAEPRDAAFRRRDAARRDRPRAGAPAGRLPDGRAAVLARRQAPGGPAAGAEAHPARSRRHHPLRHARPDRGHDDGQPHRHPEPGPAGPDRHAARDLRGAAEPLRGGAARPAGDQPLPAGPACRTSGRRPATRTIGARTEHFRIARATERRRAMRRSTGSSISATRPTCMSASAATSW